MEPEILEPLVRRDMVQYHDAQHLSEGKDASSDALTLRGGQLRFPGQDHPGEVIQATEQSNGSFSMSEPAILCSTQILNQVLPGLGTSPSPSARHLKQVFSLAQKTAAQQNSPQTGLSAPQGQHNWGLDQSA